MIKKTAYVVGTEVKQSLSPTIFKYWFKKYNIEGAYKYKQINQTNFNKEIKLILKENPVCGLNITMPFKEKIIPHLSKISLDAKKIGAVNWLFKNTRGDFCGENSDWLGFQKSIGKHSAKKNTAIVIGYGGASKAVIYSLVVDGYKNIKIFNRNYNKIKKLKTLKIKTYNLKDLYKHTNDADLIVNTTPTNTLKYISKNKINQESVGFDIVYRPKKGTGFLNHFKRQNRIEGIYMLIFQAAPCFHKWFGVLPSIDNGLLNALFKKMEEKNK